MRIKIYHKISALFEVIPVYEGTYFKMQHAYVPFKKGIVIKEEIKL